MEIGTTLDLSSAREFGDWLEAHGAREREIWPVLFKKSSGKQTVRYEELVEVALCYGWIDGLEKGIDAERYAIRFTPRRKKSNWTTTNRALARRLIAEGRMTPAGLAALPSDFDEG